MPHSSQRLNAARTLTRQVELEISMGRGDPTLGNLLFLLFAGISVVSAFLIAEHFHSRRLAVYSSVAVLLFFAILYYALEALMQWLGL